MAHNRAIYTIGPRCKVVIVFFLSFPLLSTISYAGLDEPAILPAPVISSEYFPCSRCHPQNAPEPDVHREAFHATILATGHIEENYGCNGCHDRENRDKLQLFNGGEIGLTDSSRLCGQCHSTNYTLWQTGLHGKVVGRWNGPKEITPCTTCHDPHQPGYRVQQPGPPPTPPEQTLWWQR